MSAFVCLVYLAFASDGTFRFRPSRFPHHVLIADAWLHGQLHVRDAALERVTAPFYARERARAEGFYRARGAALTDAEWQRLRARIKAPALHDWSVVDGRLYGYWGPAPTVLLLPYVAVAGLDASDRLAGAVVGALTVLLAYLALREADRRGLLPVTAPAAVALAAMLGLGTVQLYLAVAGQVWFFTQVVAAFFLMLAVFSVLRSDRSASWAALAGLGLGMSFLSRNSELLTGLFFAVAIVATTRGLPRTGLVRLGAAFAAPLVLCGTAMLAFNAARFGNPLETGLKGQIDGTANQRFAADFHRFGSFDARYLPGNLYYYFLNPKLPKRADGTLTFDPEGNSMFLVTPALLYALVWFRRRSWLTAGAWAGVAVCLAALLFYFVRGWVTFGNRYLLDVWPLLLLLVAAGMKGRLTPASAALIALSVAINFWGAFRFLY